MYRGEISDIIKSSTFYTDYKQESKLDLVYGEEIDIDSLETIELRDFSEVKKQIKNFKNDIPVTNPNFIGKYDKEDGIKPMLVPYLVKVRKDIIKLSTKNINNLLINLNFIS